MHKGTAPCPLRSYFEVESPAAPALRYLCLIDTPVTLDYYNEALKTVHSVHKVLFFWGAFTETMLYETDLGQPSDWGVLADHPVKAVTIDLPNHKTSALRSAIGKIWTAVQDGMKAELGIVKDRLASCIYRRLAVVEGYMLK